jgi:hypothetical protein
MSLIDNHGRTTLIRTLEYYSSKYKSNHKILHNLLNTDCKPNHVDNYDRTALLCALKYFGSNPNCDHKILIKLLNMDYRLGQCDEYSDKVLKCAFMHYSKNPNYSSNVFIKIIKLKYPNIERSNLIDVLRKYTSNINLRNDIFKNYHARWPLVANRLFRRCKMGKRDSIYLFN